MLQWRLKLREARLALLAGRYEDAYRVLSDAQLRQFLPAQQLAGELAEKYVDRAAQRFEWGQSSAGFADLAAVEKLGSKLDKVDAIRRKYIRRAEHEAASSLAAQQPQAALATLKRVGHRGVGSAGLRALERIASGWSNAQDLAEAGDMPQAKRLLDRAAADGEADALLAVDQDIIQLKKAIAAAQRALQENASSYRLAKERLHAAAIEGDWAAALRAAEESLQLAPRDQATISLRRRAWKKLELDKTRAYGTSRRDNGSEIMNGQDHAAEAKRLARAIRDTTAKPPASNEDTAIGAQPANRRMLWVDSVGGYLICLNEEIVLGQPSGGAAPTVPVLADISRRHAVLRRDHGAYVLEPVGPTTLDGKPITGPTVLGDDHLIGLGESVEVRFVRPHALSATARLTVTSGHRTAPSADAVLLMAESCVLGAGKHSHVRCRDWTDDLILFRQNESLCCRSGASLSVDGSPAHGATPLPDSARIEGQDFAVSVELV